MRYSIMYKIRNRNHAPFRGESLPDKYADILTASIIAHNLELCCAN